MSKRGSTWAARNSALKTPYPPLPYIIWTLWTWGFTRYHVLYTIPFSKNWANRDWVIHFLGYFGWFLRSGRRFSKFECFSNFSNYLSIFHTPRVIYRWYLSQKNLKVLFASSPRIALSVNPLTPSRIQKISYCHTIIFIYCTITFVTLLYAYQVLC